MEHIMHPISVARAVMEKVLGVDKNAWIPELATQKFRRTFELSLPHWQAGVERMLNEAYSR